MLVSTVAAAMVALRLPPYTIAILCFLQAVSGATGAYASVFRDMVRKYVYHPTEVTRAVTRRKLCQAIGTSCGPLLSAAAGVVVVHPDQGYVAGIFVLGPLFVVYVAALFILYPEDLRPLVREENGVEEEAFLQGMSSKRRDVMLLSYLAASMLLTISLSAVENATVAILSMEFHYTYIQGGIFVSISFISYPFVDYVYDKVRKEYTEESILRCGITTVAMASLLLSGSLCSWAASMSSCLWFILFADMLMFPLLQLCQGILQGWALRYATREGPLSASTMTILRVSLCSFARGCGPWLSRSILENGGRNYYTAAQIMLISVALLIVEAGVTPFTEAIRDGELTRKLSGKGESESKNSPSMDSTAPSTPQLRAIV
jgi:MFS family permease